MAGLVVDNFAGGGGASLGIEWGLGRPVDIAVNHDPRAVAMHRANHPHTRHLCTNVFSVDPMQVCGGRPVDLAWFSPDCTHHSRAKGGKPRKKEIRGLAWVVHKWVRAVRPRVIILENVLEFADWGPLTEEGRPCPDRKGQTFNFWVEMFRRRGYTVEWMPLRACAFGAPTIRQRMFLVARCDGLPIVWPDATHGPEGSGLDPYRTAADIIDWSIPCPSIFERRRPLADATLARIARGLRRYVIEAADPFIVPVTHQGDRRFHPVTEPLRTITTAQRGEFALVTPYLARQFGHSVGGRVDDPVGTVMAGGGGKTALVTAFLAKHFGGMTGVGVDTPFPTVTTVGTQNQLVTSNLVKLRGTCRDGQPVTEPMPTVTAGGWHVGEVRAFLMKYYGTGGQWQDCRDPVHTLTDRARMGLVTVHGEDYQIADIGMRMLTPRELFRAQGFPDTYVIDPLFQGRKLTKSDQVSKCGNSVSPHPAAALVRANMAAAGAMAGSA